MISVVQNTSNIAPTQNIFLPHRRCRGESFLWFWQRPWIPSRQATCQRPPCAISQASQKTNPNITVQLFWQKQKTIYTQLNTKKHCRHVTLLPHRIFSCWDCILCFCQSSVHAPVEALTVPLWRAWCNTQHCASSAASFVLSKKWFMVFLTKPRHG